MRRQYLSCAIYIALLSTTLTLMSGCSDDESFKFKDVDGLEPTLTLETNHIQTETGRLFTFKGKIEDKDGIRSIRLKNDELFLDKTIDLLDLFDKPVYSYELDYSFTTPKDQEGDSFDVLITVTDLGGRTVEQTVKVTMDGDFVSPVFTSAPDASLTVLAKDETKLNLRFSVSDDKALDYVVVSIPSIQFEETIAVDGNLLDYSKAILLPSTIGSHELTLIAVDKFKHEVTHKSIINVSEMPDFPKMYLTDVNEASQLTSDLYGIPMLIDHTAPYTYSAKYYSEAPGTEVRFVPQKTDFSPICFGINPNDNDALTDEPELSLPIILEEKGYYEIVFNVLSGEYSVEKYTPTDEPLAIGEIINYNDGTGDMPFQMALVGAGLPGVGNWQTQNGYILQQDSENPYILYAEMQLTAGTEIEFTISPTHPWGWWYEPFWRFDNSGENEYNVKNGGDNMTKVTVMKDGKYMFKFDTHLERSKFYPID